MRMRFAKLVKCVKNLYFRFYDDEVPALGAQLAYYFLLAFFPFLIFLMTLVGFSPVSGEEVLQMASHIFPETVFLLIRDNISLVADYKNSGLLSFGIITTLWAASNGVGAVIRGLNKAYDEEEVRPFWKVKGEAILFTVALVVVIVFTFLLLIFGRNVWQYLSTWLGLPEDVYRAWNVLRYGVMLIMMIIVFAALYHYTPNRILTWREVMPGAIFATFGWVLTSLGFACYVNNFTNYSKIYGSIGGVIVLLIWLFISAMIVLLGGELNATLAFDREGKEKPKGKKY